MRINTIQFLLVILLQCGVLVDGLAQQRIYLSGKDATTAIDWDFKISQGRNSGHWTSIPVPSNWETEGFGNYTYGRDNEEYKTKPEIGYYLKKFNFKKVEGKRYFIVFQGSMTDTKVVLNSQQVGEVHMGGFTEFNYEVTAYLKNGDNLMEVEVSKSSSNLSVQKAERIADFWLFGGIFRPVYIEEVPVNFIEHVAIDGQMTGDFTMDVIANVNREDLSLSAQIYDAQKQKVGKSFSTNLKGAIGHLASRFKNVDAWSHEFPNIYSVEVQLKTKGKVIHTYIQKFGFRTFEVRDNDGFYLNGKRILLKGANMHSFRPETGRTLSKNDMLENVRLMQQLNFNCVRACHYPPDGYFFDLCDSLGLLAMDEITGWTNSLATDIGRKLVKELVVRDVNHPCVILWGNGNHNAHNPDFDEVFFKWDPQKRRPLKNAPKSAKIFSDYFPEFDIVNTTYYPNYTQITQRLFKEDHIVLPNECLHALYDGGGGANLKTYWDAFEASKVGGGLMIWALFDEGLLRTDLGNKPDNQINKAADGLVGPHGEKEGSYYAVREIWSPVHIEEEVIRADFDGILSIENKFSFVNLNQCRLNWILIKFAQPNASSSGFRTVAKGRINTPDIKAGSKGNIQISLPQHTPRYDALAIEVIDNKGTLVYEKRLPVEKEDSYFQTSENRKFVQDKENPFLFYFGNTTLEFNESNGVLKTIAVEGKPTSITNFPFIDAKPVDSILNHVSSTPGKTTIRKDNDDYILEAHNTNGFDYLKWSLKPSGEIKLDYQYALQKGDYYYVGIGMEVNSGDVKSKRWLGEGPARIWKNRTEGGTMDVYAVDKKKNIPGEIYNQPEFEGCFAPWKWAVFYMENNFSIGFKNNSDVVLGVLNPINGKAAKDAKWHYPEKEGFYFFNAISAVGSKWKKQTEFGPDAQPNIISNNLIGSVSLFINWNSLVTKNEYFKVEIE
jgi:hypothetical protein